jgi:hypothetical protein
MNTAAAPTAMPTSAHVDNLPRTGVVANIYRLAKTLSVIRDKSEPERVVSGTTVGVGTE